MNDYNYNSLRIAIILQLKKDFLDGLVHEDQLWRILHTDYMSLLCAPVHPDEVYKAFNERKVKQQWPAKSDNFSKVDQFKDRTT